jgi:hypothetical protein
MPGLFSGGAVDVDGVTRSSADQTKRHWQVEMSGARGALWCAADTDHIGAALAVLGV